MAPKFKVGQKVVVSPVHNEHLSPRECGLEPYAGQSGEVVDYYWITLGEGTTDFYIYNVRIGAGYEVAVLHEDELEVYRP